MRRTILQRRRLTSFSRCDDINRLFDYVQRKFIQKYIREEGVKRDSAMERRMTNTFEYIQYKYKYKIIVMCLMIVNQKNVDIW